MVRVQKGLGLATGGAIACALAALVTPAAAQAPGMKALDGLEKGQWQVRFRSSEPARSICVRTGRELLQLRHRQGGCNRFVVEGGANSVTVQYKCPGNGYGRTNIRRESARLVQIDSQGIEGGLPFQSSAEARRTGACR